MLKVKFITSINTEMLEKEVNLFISDKKISQICYQSVLDGRLIRDRVMVVYEES